MIVNSIKELHDFSGNLYYAFEFLPTGYCVVHNESRLVVELGIDSPSPYLGYTKGLFYGGPTYYYVVGTDTCRHTLLNEVLTEQDMEIAAASSAELHLALCSQEQKTETQVIASVSAGTCSYIAGGSFYQDINENYELGYFSVDNGVCGFIAAGLFLLYWDLNRCPEIINNFAFLNEDGTAYIDSDFNKKLFYSYGTGASSSASGLAAETSIKNVLEDYLNDVNCNIGLSIITMPTYSYVMNHLQNANTPLIWFGVLKSADAEEYIQHAVLAYGWTTNEEYIIVNYGWKDYAHVELIEQIAGEALVGHGCSSNTMSFSDIPITNWAYDEVAYCARYGIIESNSKSTFGYSAPMTRAMFVNGLYHLAGEPKVNQTSLDGFTATFSDVTSNTQYREALAWAYSKGYINGMSQTTMSPTSYVTREQAAKLLQAFCTGENYSFSDTSGPSYTYFLDSADISSWARASVTWACNRRLFSGDEHRCFLPQNTITKAEAAAVFYRITDVADRGN